MCAIVCKCTAFSNACVRVCVEGGSGRNAKLTLKKQFPCNPSAAWRQSRRYSANYKINGHEFPQLSHPQDPWSPELSEAVFKRADAALSPSMSLPLNPCLPLSHFSLTFIHPWLSITPPRPIPSSSPLTFILPSLLSHGELVIRRLKLWAQHFSFFSQAGEKTPNRHWLVGDRPGLMKSKLSIRAQHLHIGTNEARRSPTLIPLHLTHFIDSPCFPNEMLNISPSAAAHWQLLLWRWREWERNVTVTHTHTCTQKHTHSRVCTQIKI